MSDKLCPFCGVANSKYVLAGDGGDAYQCQNCGAMVNSLDDWQSRPLEDAANARAEVAEAQVAALQTALDAANQDSALMDKLVMDAICRQTGTIDADAGLAAHRAHNDRIGGAK